MEFLKSLVELRAKFSEVTVTKFLIHYALINSFRMCCGKKCYYESKGVDKESTWRCSNQKCRRRYSVREGSIFSRFKIRLNKIMEVLVCWILKYPSNVIVAEVGICSVSVAELIECFRELIEVWLVENGKRKIGGSGHIVEIDESAFGKRKYNRGRMTQTQWVVGGIDRTTKEAFFVRVDRRDATTLRHVLLENVLPGSTIKTDCWRGYDLKGLPYESHDTVNHSKHFVNPSDLSTHTQNIEAQWSKAKRDLRRRVGRMNSTTYESFLVEWTWRSRHATVEELFLDFCSACTVLYNIN